ncbi:MAG: hypothetical protein M1610_08300 [Nitrospirae bacterium]|jgi:DNA-directed RNA polymerase subunit RPC12/RpoP|nr:hypothetical protein [Nitrospirota bacterium]MCL5062194.1 hypothetical protein [Nitrospirota bacterium]
MKERQSPLKSACSIKYAPVPEIIACPKCKEEIELWSDEDEAACHSCGYVFLKDKAGNQSC